MNYKEQVIALWNDMNNKDWNNIHSYFNDKAKINWNNTNEEFNLEEYARANCEYPGDWSIKIERLDCIGSLVISVVKVHLKNVDVSFHGISFFEFNNDKINLLNEYWGDDGKVPQWRIDKQIGKPINNK